MNDYVSRIVKINLQFFETSQLDNLAAIKDFVSFAALLKYCSL